MEQQVAGIDVAKLTLDIVLTNGQKTLHNKFENTPKGHELLARWLTRQGANTAHVCMEATGQYGDGIAEYLYSLGFPVSVVNPARIKHYANSKLRRNKTDKADAQIIAEFCYRENPGLWTPPPAIFKDLQALVRHLDGLQATRQQEVNRLNSGVKTLAVIESLKQICAFFDDQIKQTKEAIQTLIDQHSELKRRQSLLITIPGIAKLTAAKLLGKIRDIQEFQNARQLAAYAGLTPRNFVSGTSVHKKARLSKTGNAHLRKILYMPAISARKWNSIVSIFCDRLALTGLRPMELIGAAMRKLIHLIFGILKRGKPFDPNYLATSQTLP
ncbi:MAG: IS110 family transposase [Chloroflexi bacterium]|nr:IS110 family transposase [Chloroflexota bacterium]BCY17436.1 IS110 family transposase [Leptolinea sp. HRD-7]